jgi:NADH-quinone oxidoreductase subunit G
MSDVTIYLDGRRFQAEEGRNLLDVALNLGFDVPYFCWHPAMGSVGACRQCAVRLYWGDDDETGEIAMSCMTTVRDRLRAAIHDEEAVEFRRSVIELLMASHPHDCPVCDEGGECHLQDMTVMTGHVYRRYRGRKRTYRNQDLGPFLTHEMNRCIQCYRCLRFYVDYAGDHDFGAYGLRNHVYFGRFEDGTLRNEFSGNLVEVCPVGVFNDKTLAQTYTRKWDLLSAPSVCPHCGRGCNVILGERYGELRRVLNRFNAEVNGYFICDRGRFGYQVVNGEDRVRRAFLRDEAPQSGSGDTAQSGPGGTEQSGPGGTEQSGPGGLRESGHTGWLPSTPHVRSDLDAARQAPWERPPSTVAATMVRRLGELLRAGAGVVGIGSPRASLEANYALRRLVGSERFHVGFADAERDLVDLVIQLHRDAGLHSPSTSELERADLVVIVGEDLTNVVPMLAFTLRRWLRVRPTAEEAALHILPWNDAGVGDVKRYMSSALWSATTAPSRLDRVSAGPLHAAPQDIARAALAVAHAFDRSLPIVDGLDEHQSAWVETLVYALMDSERPLVVTGTGSGSADVLLAAATLARTLPGCVGLSVAVPEANTIGLGLMGGRCLSEAFAAASAGELAAAVILENDLFRRAGAAEVRQFVEGCPFPVALDHTLTPTVASAAGVLPAAIWAESTGTFVSHEGRAQRFASCLTPGEQTLESWRWLALVMEAAGRAPGWRGLDDVLREMADDLPQLAGARDAMPGTGFREHGMKVSRGPRRYSGRTAMHAPDQMVEPLPAVDPDSPLAFSMEGFDPEGSGEQPPASLLPRFWSPAWNSVQALNKFQEEIGGQLRGDHSGVLLFGPPAGSDGGTEEPEATASASAGRAEELAAPASARAAEEKDMAASARGGAAAPASAVDPLSAPSVPPPFTPEPGEWLVVPLHHIFGSDELSALAPAVAGRVPAPYLALGEADAAALFAAGGGYARLDWGGVRARLPIRRLAGLPHGVAGLPVGLPGLPGILPPFTARITPEGAADA